MTRWIFTCCAFVFSAYSSMSPTYAQEVGNKRFQSNLEKAKAGNAAAQTSLAGMYRYGYSVPKNYAEAVKWFRKAAEQGYAEAQLYLGIMYDTGEGVPENDAEAVRWYRKASEQGDASAQGQLGSMYKKGDGVPENYIKAYSWYSLSAAKGNEFSQSQKQILAGKMTKEQIAKAQELSAICFANNYKNCD